MVHISIYSFCSGWNVGTHLFLAWIGLDCIFLGINSIIWDHNTVNWAPVWCDICQFFFRLKQWLWTSQGAYTIAARITLGVSVALPASILCINRRLYLLASPSSLLFSQADKRRELMIDLVIGIGLPVLEMTLGLSWYYLYTYLLAQPALQWFSLKTVDLRLLKAMGVVHQLTIPGSQSRLSQSRQSS